MKKVSVVLMMLVLPACFAVGRAGAALWAQEQKDKQDEQKMDAKAYLERGLAHANKSEWDEAIADYTKAIELDPKLAKAYYGRGLARYKKDDFKGAIENWQKAIELDPFLKAKLEPAIRETQKKLGK